MLGGSPFPGAATAGNARSILPTAGSLLALVVVLGSAVTEWPAPWLRRAWGGEINTPLGAASKELPLLSEGKRAPAGLLLPRQETKSHISPMARGGQDRGTGNGRASPGSQALCSNH